MLCLLAALTPPYAAMGFRLTRIQVYAEYTLADYVCPVSQLEILTDYAGARSMSGFTDFVCSPTSEFHTEMYVP